MPNTEGGVSGTRFRRLSHMILAVISKTQPHNLL